MFTGLVRAVGEVLRAERRSGGMLLGVKLGGLPTELAAPEVGDSLAVSGCCLTVKELEGGAALFDVVEETLSRTTLGSWRPGRRVNLEPPLRAGDPFGGHFVTGHVDGVAEVRTVRPLGASVELELSAGAEIMRCIVLKGSVAVDGVSLTVASLAGACFGAALVPHTLAVTTLGELRPGDAVNVETDLIVKAVRRTLEASGRAGDGPTLEFLREHGFA